jgi:hypothetical protein
MLRHAASAKQAQHAPLPAGTSPSEAASAFCSGTTLLSCARIGDDGHDCPPPAALAGRSRLLWARAAQARLALARRDATMAACARRPWHGRCSISASRASIIEVAAIICSADGRAEPAPPAGAAQRAAACALRTAQACVARLPAGSARAEVCVSR